MQNITYNNSRMFDVHSSPLHSVVFINIFTANLCSVSFSWWQRSHCVCSLCILTKIDDNNYYGMQNWEKRGPIQCPMSMNVVYEKFTIFYLKKINDRAADVVDVLCCSQTWSTSDLMLRPIWLILTFVEAA